MTFNIPQALSKNIHDIMAMDESSESPPDGCYHYEDSSELPYDSQKYWHQRYNIFSRYDEGVWLTEDSWYGVTPEPVADTIAKHVSTAAPASKTILIDTFAGVGGNTIAFAKSGRWERIFAIEKDPAALACAKHNAEIYGVAKKIWWIEGDCFDAVSDRLAGVGAEAVVFGSPPWGGPGYGKDHVFNLQTMKPYSLGDLHKAFSRVTKEIILYLPRTSDLNQVGTYAEDERQLPVIHYCTKGASKALCVYFGNFNFD